MCVAHVWGNKMGWRERGKKKNKKNPTRTLPWRGVGACVPLGFQGLRVKNGSSCCYFRSTLCREEPSLHSPWDRKGQTKESNLPLNLLPDIKKTLTFCGPRDCLRPDANHIPQVTQAHTMSKHIDPSTLLWKKSFSKKYTFALIGAN